MNRRGTPGTVWAGVPSVLPVPCGPSAGAGPRVPHRRHLRPARALFGGLGPVPLGWQGRRRGCRRLRGYARGTGAGAPCGAGVPAPSASEHEAKCSAASRKHGLGPTRAAWHRRCARGPVGLGPVGFAGDGRGSLARLVRARGRPGKDFRDPSVATTGFPGSGGFGLRSSARSRPARRSGRRRQDPTARAPGQPHRHPGTHPCPCSPCQNGDPKKRPCWSAAHRGCVPRDEADSGHNRPEPLAGVGHERPRLRSRPEPGHPPSPSRGGRFRPGRRLPGLPRRPGRPRWGFARRSACPPRPRPPGRVAPNAGRPTTTPIRSL
ncbi:hypothetical protein HNR06_005129 [Nocardiopsis arvandica]|uniref:Uncharacterized protein n=1 Tax=Nocardiopsis sinuspersici TaxID=501010 RepID=A0A7Y9XJ64_9ACTN|nr:hypothetical protein [Nocardiopsis sinuspersici]